MEETIFVIAPQYANATLAPKQGEEEEGAIMAARGREEREGKNNHDGSPETCQVGASPTSALPQLVGSLDSEEELEEEGGILKQTKVAIDLWRKLQKSKTPGGQVNASETDSLKRRRLPDDHLEGNQKKKE